MATEDAELARLRWQCRRGLLELDYLLEAFLEREYPRLAAEEQARFVALLQCSDPELQAWLIHGETPAEDVFLPLVARLRAVRP